jgi:hypothetical protein
MLSCEQAGFRHRVVTGGTRQVDDELHRGISQQRLGRWVRGRAITLRHCRGAREVEVRDALELQILVIGKRFQVVIRDISAADDPDSHGSPSLRSNASSAVERRSVGSTA